MTPKILAGIAAFGLSVALMLDKSWWFLAALAVGTALLTTKDRPFEDEEASGRDNR